MVTGVWQPIRQWQYVQDGKVPKWNGGQPRSPGPRGRLADPPSGRGESPGTIPLVRYVAQPRTPVRIILAKGKIFHMTVLYSGRPGTRFAGMPDGPVAQLDRVADFYSAGCRFESCRDRHEKPYKTRHFRSFWLRSLCQTVLRRVPNHFQRFQRITRDSKSFRATRTQREDSRFVRVGGDWGGRNDPGEREPHGEAPFLFKLFVAGCAALALLGLIELLCPLLAVCR